MKKYESARMIDMIHLIKLKCILCCASFFSLIIASIDHKTDSTASAKKPNFIIIYTDDQGYGDLGSFGGTHVSTPHLDKLAEEGAKLTNFYMAAAVCTPSRAALMTGSYPKRVNMAKGAKFGVLLAGEKKGLNPKEITIAEVLKTQGYSTGMFGKWHLGDQPEFLPTRQGFDEFWGIPYSHDLHPFHPQQKRYKFPSLPLLNQETVIEEDPDADYLTKRITEKAVDFIQRHKDSPFFLYIPHPIPHHPIHASPPFMKSISPSLKEALAKEDGFIDYVARGKLYKESLEEVDWSVAQIIDTLKQYDLDENTLILFTSDNGPSRGYGADKKGYGSSGPLRGGKGSVYEGGSRVPALAWWPTQIPSKTTSDEILSAMDILPTFVYLAGTIPPQDRTIDGKNIWPVLSGKPNAKSPHDALFFHKGNQLKAVRAGVWKLHVTQDRKKNWKAKELYNLASDIGEKHNVLRQHPEKVKELLAKVKEFDLDIRKNNRPAGFVKKAQPLRLKKD